jgi:transposase
MQASFAFEGATDKDAFVTFVHEVLVPTLSPGQVVVMDNLGAHKVKRVKEAIEAAGCLLIYLPPYAPELNPIEECWSKVKTILRKVGARTKQALSDAIGDAFKLR